MESFKDKTMKEERLLPVGTKVFDVQLGWGEVVGHSESTNCPLKIKFDNYIEIYAFDGKVSLDDKVPVLSLTEYTLENGGFTPISDYWTKPKVGDWGYFWDSEKDFSDYAILGKLLEIKETTHSYCSSSGVHWRHFSREIPEHIKKQMQQ